MKSLNYIECNCVSGGAFLPIGTGLGVTSGILIVVGGIIAVMSRVNIRPCTERECSCLGDSNNPSLNCTSSIKKSCTCGPSDSPDNH
ncbi:MAG: hypothetical protein KKE11_03230 [Gammaproteobacteria bacterium]|nr:hypothetical protein [Gammaproteobacteria bacterium]